MNVRQGRWLGGANIWAACPVLDLVLDLGDACSWPAERICQMAALLAEQLPGPPQGSGQEGLPGLADSFGRAVLRLQSLAGTPVSFHASSPAGPAGLFRVGVECEEEALGRAAVETALRLLASAGEGKSTPLEEDLRRLRDLEAARFPPNRQAGVIHEAARSLGVPVARLHPEYRGYLRLGQGARQQRCRGCEPNLIGAVARMASTDKYLTKALLREVGVPVPEGRLVSSAEDAWAAASELGLPVATKPLDSFLATGVSLDLRTREQVEQGFRAASEHSRDVLVERFAPGLEHRVLVVGGRVSAVARIEPPHVVGDGISTVAELVALANQDPRRGEGDAPLRPLELDEVADAILAGQGYNLRSVPPANQWVLVRRNPPYLSHGGNLLDLTDSIHPGNAAHAVAAARALQVMVAGLDVVAVDISRPLEEQGGVVVEVNVSPGLWLHLAPWSDRPRPVGLDIVKAMFPPGSDGRLPVVALLGDGAGLVKKHLAGLLTLAGLRAGIAGEKEIEVGGRRWPAPSRGPLARAAALMQHTEVDVAILETNPTELVREGFGNDRCAVAILLGEIIPGKAELEGEGDSSSGDFLSVLRHALAPGGAFVVLAGGKSAVTSPAAATGGRTLLVREGAFLLRGEQTEQELGKLPQMSVKEEEALLAALAAGLALGLEDKILSGYLREAP